MDLKRGWKVRSSDFAAKTHNPIRAIVESLQLEPNPEKQMIALSIGDPTVFGNLTPPEQAVEAVKRSVDSGRFNGYAPSAGFQEARQAVADYSSSEGVQVDARDVVLCSGCSSALDMCIAVLAGPGNNILAPRPGFSIYKTLAEGLGVHIKYYNLQADNNWEIDLEDLESVIDENTTAIVVNNPSNPCGSVFSRSHLRDILGIAEKYYLPIIADEIYEHLVFPGEEFHSLASLSSQVPILSCSGLTKRFLVPGWRMGWIIIHDRNDVLSEVRGGLIKLSQRIMGSNTLVQGAMPDILKYTPPGFYNNTILLLQKNARVAFDLLSQIRGLKPVMPQGAMYMMVGIAVHEFPNIKSEIEFVEMMVMEESVFCLPGKCFDYPNYMRIVLAAPEEMLREACERISLFCGRHIAGAKLNSRGNNPFRGELCSGCENSGRKP